MLGSSNFIIGNKYYQLFFLEVTGPFVHFEKMPAKYPVWKKHSLSSSLSSKGGKKCCMRKKKKVVSSTHKLISLEITITHWNAVKVVYAYCPFYYTECFEKYQYLVRFIIFTASSRTFLNETDICFYGRCVVMMTATVWCPFDSYSRDGISTHPCFRGFSANVNKMKNATNVVIQLWRGF